MSFRSIFEIKAFFMESLGQRSLEGYSAWGHKGVVLDWAVNTDSNEVYVWLRQFCGVSETVTTLLIGYIPI